MMEVGVPARVHWVPPEKGGRLALPTGQRYMTVSRFEEDAGSWLRDAWSIVLEFDEPPSEQGNPSLATARFLVAESPVGRLKPGRKFELYEGKNRTALVEILQSQR